MENYQYLVYVVDIALLSSLDCHAWQLSLRCFFVLVLIKKVPSVF